MFNFIYSDILKPNDCTIIYTLKNVSTLKDNITYSKQNCNSVTL